MDHSGRLIRERAYVKIWVSLKRRAMRDQMVKVLWPLEFPAQSVMNSALALEKATAATRAAIATH